MNAISSIKNFTRNSERAGLKKRGCGLLAVEALQRLLVTPVPRRERRSDSEAPSDEQSMGVLIAAGCARFDRENEQYVSTPAGHEWIAALVAAKLVKPRELRAGEERAKV